MNSSSKLRDARDSGGHFTELQLLLWSVVGAVVFTFSWFVTGGGFVCSLPIFAACSLYCCTPGCLSSCCWANLKENICSICLATSLKRNLKWILKEDKKVVMLIFGYFSAKSFLLLFYPALESSNGSPLSLILFTVLFISIYLASPILAAIFRLLRSLCKGQVGIRLCGEKAASISGSILTFKSSLLAISGVVLLTYLLDGEISSFLRFVGAGKPCWPLLVPASQINKGQLPPNLLGSIQWHSKWKDYRPHWTLQMAISYGRELGEVCHLLPTLIGTFVLAQLLLPPAYYRIKEALFACIAGVVLGGVTSGSFKVLFHRYRPNAYGNPYLWTGPGMTTVNHLQFSKLDLSFPAGHTTVTTAVATCLYVFATSSLSQVKMSRMAAFLLLLCLYTHPVLVLMSRVSDCFHWTSDTSFGVSVWGFWLTCDLCSDSAVLYHKYTVDSLTPCLFPAFPDLSMSQNIDYKMRVKHCMYLEVDLFPLIICRLASY